MAVTGEKTRCFLERWDGCPVGFKVILTISPRKCRFQHKMHCNSRFIPPELSLSKLGHIQKGEINPMRDGDSENTLRLLQRFLGNAGGEYLPVGHIYGRLLGVFFCFLFLLSIVCLTICEAIQIYILEITLLLPSLWKQRQRQLINLVCLRFRVGKESEQVLSAIVTNELGLRR